MFTKKHAFHDVFVNPMTLSHFELFWNIIYAYNVLWANPSSLPLLQLFPYSPLTSLSKVSAAFKTPLSLLLLPVCKCVQIHL